MLLRLLLLTCAPLCEPTGLLLTVRPSRLVEGGPMTLSCVNQLHQRLPGPPQFQFLKDGHALGLGWDNSSQYQVAAVWREDVGYYWCEVWIEHRVIKSKRMWIDMHRVPVRNVSLETQPAGGHVAEGQTLVLACLVSGGTGDINFLWYRGALGVKLETKTQRSLSAKFEIPAVRESDADQYYCSADNGYGPRLSGLVSVTVTVPVSRPVLTLRAPGAPALVGDTVELHCEAQTGSPPILYRFYHDGVTLGNSSAPSGGGVSFNLSLTAEHSGNYSCEADNGVGAQRSEVVPFSVTAPREDRAELTTAVVVEGLFGLLGLLTAVLLICCWCKRKMGQPSARDSVRSPPLPPPRESTYLNTAPEQRQPIYQNVNVGRGDEVYSLAFCMQQEWQPAAAEALRMPANGPDPSVIYSGVMKVDVTDKDYEDAM
ncbi:Fc receptor like 1 [Rhinolophus ferrumequinum]|uniref:Fc receptor like 1 n=1 Tax=Rhinolophus ferrumequinum TaxID=59479 RepID=A0A7J7SWW9_RHIFE|nr:Fc receptor like 1 [Rhinolophus ferrumequinum]